MTVDSVKAAILYPALALASCLLSARLIDSVLPDPNGEPFDKLAYFTENKDSYDVLFFGSSRIICGLVPHRFDTEMARAGFPVRSFNFAENGMRPHETAAVIDRVLAMAPARLNWTVIELNRWSGFLQPKLSFRWRTIAWHNLPNTMSAMRSVLLYNRQPQGERMNLLTGHFLHFAAYSAALGRGQRAWMQRSKRRGQGRSYPSWITEDRGFRQPPWGGPAAMARQLDQYQRLVERLRAKKARTLDLSGYNRWALEAQTQRLRDAGIVPLYIIPPGVRPTPYLLGVDQEGLVEHVLRFNDPDSYPKLYDSRHRQDIEHLNAQGAEILSTLVAQRMAALLEASEN